jgi:AraC-like DNA-binding protein
MMPQKDGFEVCNTLKQDERTSHIPIILLTAKADLESKIEGLKRGADAYLAKPFNDSELRAHVENLLEQRRKLQAVFQSVTLFDHTRIENDFLKKLNTAIEANLSDAGYGLEQLCQLTTMSHSQLFRKIKALTGRSVVSYIRYYRLQKAHRFLVTTGLTIAEIAYATGFNDPNYFTRIFRREFGKSPTSIRNAGPY